MLRKKKTAQILNIHAKRRAQERYGVEINKHARREMINQIRTNQAQLLNKVSRCRSVWKVNHNGVGMVAVYDAIRSTICTFLPQDAKEAQVA